MEISVSTGYYPSTYSFWTFKPVYLLRSCDYKFKIGAIRILLSENTFAGHWETVVDCMENIEKRQQWLILPKNCLRTQLWFNQNIRSSIQKVPMTAPSRGSLWYPQWITTMDNNGQQWTTMDNNGQKFTTMDNSGQQWTTVDNNPLCYMHLWCRFIWLQRQGQSATFPICIAIRLKRKH